MNAQTRQSITVITAALTRPPALSAAVARATASCLTAKRAMTSMSVERRLGCAVRSARTPSAPTFVNVLLDSWESQMAIAAARTATSHRTLSSATVITWGICRQTEQPTLLSCRAWPVWWLWTLIALTSTFIGSMWVAEWLRECPMMAVTEKWLSMEFCMEKALQLTG